MMVNCPVCGKRTVIHWPEHWVYKIGKIYYCGENCVQVQRTRNLNMLRDVIRKRKEAKEMARMKKDGTPAKKPGPRPKVKLVYDESIAEEYRREQEEKARRAEEAEAPQVTVAIDHEELPDIEEPEEQLMGMAPAPVVIEDVTLKNVINGMPAEDVLVTAIRMGSLGEFYFDRKYRTIDWRNGTGEEVSLMPDEWRRLAEAIPRMMKLLGVEV